MKAVLGFLAAIIAVAFLNGCADRSPAQKTYRTPQAQEQCEAQPWLDWCLDVA